MTIDHIGVLEAESARVIAALAADRTAAIPWSDVWTVQACAQHVAGVHRWMRAVIDGRPTADFSVRAQIGPEIPEEDAAELGPWMEANTAALAELLRATDPTEPCWSWWPEATTVGFWPRRAAQETMVHRWDVELGAGIVGAAMDPVLAADGIDEFLDIFAGMTRFLHAAPGAGEAVHLHCTDTDGEWLLSFPAEGERELRREHAKGDVAFRGRAEDLLLFLWGRRDVASSGIEVLGDAATAARWSELVPPM